MEHLLKKYVQEFNNADEEHHINYVDNNSAYEWLREEIPLFECSDKDIERAYYFRWWTYRKHIKETKNGFAVSEFLLDVPWGGKYNIINAAAGHHLSEGKWLKNARKYLTDYINILLSDDIGVDETSYSSWLIWALAEYYDIVGYNDLKQKIFDRIIRYNSAWEKCHKLENSMFWSIDDRDAMEYSISGTDTNFNILKGIRPTLNSYMYADYFAIAHLADRLNKPDVKHIYREKANELKKLINNKLWIDGFYRALHFKNDYLKFVENNIHMEEIGYIPWMFNIPPKGREEVFEYLMDTSVFDAPIGITTADMREKRFMYEADHECLWNGYVWPFATSQTLKALINVIKNYGADEYKNMFIYHLKKYAKSHYKKNNNNEKIDWIDEVLHPFKQEWTSVTYLKEHNFPKQMGPKGRGKDYNHSTFCDLVISGLCGIEIKDDILISNPIVSDEIEYFRISDLHHKGKSYSFEYRKGRFIK